MIVTAVLSIFLTIAAGVLAIPGWLVNRPDSEMRFQFRMWTWFALTGVFGLWCGRFIVDRAWIGAVLNGVSLALGMQMSGNYWRKVEQVRAFKRALKQKPMWLP